jgi:hypothetical protein
MKIVECLVCGKTILPDHERIICKAGDICMPCEGAVIDVYRVALHDEQNNGYLEKDLQNIVDMLSEVENGQGFLIIKKSMRAAEYFNLPEFMGF